MQHNHAELQITEHAGLAKQSRYTDLQPDVMNCNELLAQNMTACL